MALAQAVNEAGRIVGRAATEGDVALHAFLWDPISGMHDLGMLGGANAEGLGYQRVR